MVWDGLGSAANLPSLILSSVASCSDALFCSQGGISQSQKHSVFPVLDRATAIPSVYHLGKWRAWEWDSVLSPFQG
ncbi:hypothetical protein BDW60DRAFT_193756 [Aspergillus nidulans var. acristatus]